MKHAWLSIASAANAHAAPISVQLFDEDYGGVLIRARTRLAQLGVNCDLSLVNLIPDRNTQGVIRTGDGEDTGLVWAICPCNRRGTILTRLPSGLPKMSKSRRSGHDDIDRLYDQRVDVLAHERAKATAIAALRAELARQAAWRRAESESPFGRPGSSINYGFPTREQEWRYLLDAYFEANR